MVGATEILEIGTCCEKPPEILSLSLFPSFPFFLAVSSFSPSSLFPGPFILMPFEHYYSIRAHTHTHTHGFVSLPALSFSLSLFWLPLFAVFVLPTSLFGGWRAKNVPGSFVPCKGTRDSVRSPSIGNTPCAFQCF